MKNYYKILDVDENATTTQIKTAYRKQVQAYHPDKHNGDKYYANIFIEIIEAYDVLSDEQRKSAYDANLKTSKRETYTTTEKNYNSQNANTTYSDPRGWKKKETYQTSYRPTYSDSYNKAKQGKSIDGKFLFGLIGFVIFFIFLLKSCGDSSSTYKDTNSSSSISVNTQANKSSDLPIDQSNKPLTQSEENQKFNFSDAPSIQPSLSPYKGNQLKTGTSPYDNCFGKSDLDYDANAYITFKNRDENDVILCLVDVVSNRTMRNVYIRKGRNYTMRNIPTGTYYIKEFFGNDWNPDKINSCGTNGDFDSNRGFSKSDSPKDYIEIHNGMRYTGGSITLYPVLNGNMSTEGMSESEYFKN